ncbi:maleylpyruvate isomerase N-terminal domain-containing protein [Actinokineospora auranticolor]|uniref:Mycothiol maleylpyruvate isomerase-like protein n=1 Tax=Actinokineospora auranticolor TaxID=155976 RepID=A0A2S6GPB4_9PSEU|nr:maleylpyruvate isomerase N-terminal domain-containing protein [Actinokineospora auranticolor]PPK67074.1 mycothiol maleylpyruvate isomerase-like protein [Actinokineospora auranticolor]
MTDIAEDLIATARVAGTLLRDPAVAAAWDRPSALPEFGVSGLCGHVANQVLLVPALLAADRPVAETIPLLDHYSRSLWVDAPVDSEINTGIRDGSERIAADGPAELFARYDATVDELARTLPGTDLTRPVQAPFWPTWSLTLGDFLITRIMELVVHGDDLAVSVDVPTPDFPDGGLRLTLDLLTGLSVRRHGAPAVLRAFSRAERAPRQINAF